MEHLAIIMDGNGRWAKAHHRPRVFGHRAGADNLDRVMRLTKQAGIKYLTVYAFSTENWKRSKEEVSALMKLLSMFIKKKEKELIESEVRFRVIGRREDLSPKLQKNIAALEEKTKHFEFSLVIALSYGGRAEIVDAVKKLVKDGVKEDEITEEMMSSAMYAPDIPDPDLIVRTSGEQRTSNFLLWESAYSEYYFTPVLWPDFDQTEFDRAMDAYSKRERRMGGRLK